MFVLSNFYLFHLLFITILSIFIIRIVKFYLIQLFPVFSYSIEFLFSTLLILFFVVVYVNVNTPVFAFDKLNNILPDYVSNYYSLGNVGEKQILTEKCQILQKHITLVLKALAYEMANNNVSFSDHHQMEVCYNQIKKDFPGLLTFNFDFRNKNLAEAYDYASSKIEASFSSEQHKNIKNVLFDRLLKEKPIFELKKLFSNYATLKTALLDLNKTK